MEIIAVYLFTCIEKDLLYICKFINDLFPLKLNGEFIAVYSYLYASRETRYLENSKSQCTYNLECGAIEMQLPAIYA